MADKKEDIKRFIIYILLSFGLSWIVFFVYILSGGKWDGTNVDMEQFIGLTMLMPFTAHILTRLITKEGFRMTGKDSVMLGISFKDNKWKYYVFAVLIPWVYFEFMHIFAWIFAPEIFDENLIDELEISKSLVFAYPLITIIMCTINSFAALGEEGGWRGYMMPKLIKMMGIPKAIVVGGIIWGVWHAPLTCIGHNFGTEYAGFPYVGIIIMCIECTLMGIMLTFVTIKTESIWPAAFMHAINNGNPSIVKFFINPDIFSDKYSNPLSYHVFLFIPMVIIDAIIIVMELRKQKDHNFWGRG